MSLFQGVTKDLSNADIGWRKNKSPAYEYGYKLAAEKLLDGFEKLDTRSKDSLIFPIIFLYRQHIELALKGIIIELDRVLKNSRKNKLLECHKLLNLWDESQTLYHDFIKKNCPQPIFTSVKSSKERAIVKDFHKLDEDSFSFRYSTDKSGRGTLCGVDYVSLRNFQNEISVVIDYIGNMTQTLAHAKDI